MALKVTLPEGSTLIGVEAPDAYLRVLTHSGNKSITSVRLVAHASRAAREAGAQPVADWYVNYTTSELSGPLYPDLYAKVKQGFPDAVDILETTEG